MAPNIFAGVVWFAVNLLIGGFALYVAARHVVFRDAFRHNVFEHALVTALFGAVVWALLAWVPLVGAILALGGWIGVVHLRYPGGWVRTVALGAIAWTAAVVVLAVLDLIGLSSLTALGIPGV